MASVTQIIDLDRCSTIQNSEIRIIAAAGIAAARRSFGCAQDDTKAEGRGRKQEEKIITINMFRQMIY